MLIISLPQFPRIGQGLQTLYGLLFFRGKKGRIVATLFKRRKTGVEARYKDAS
jgi:hypothetical protein